MKTDLGVPPPVKALYLKASFFFSHGMLDFEELLMSVI